MLEQVDLSQKLDKADYKTRMELLGNQLGELHRKLHEAIETARARIEAKREDDGLEKTA